MSLDIVRWDADLQRLNGSMYDKAVKFIERDCLKPYDLGGKSGWLCGPIPGYNSTTYRLSPVQNPHRAGGFFDVHFSCSCQWYNKMVRKGDSPFCSHVMALAMHLNGVRVFKGGN